VGFFNRQKPIIELEFDKLRDAFIYHAVYININNPHDKYDKHNHGEVYGSAIDLFFRNNENDVYVQLADWAKDTAFQPYIAIHQSNKKAIEVDKVYNGMDKVPLKYLIRKSSSSDYVYIFNQHLITSGGYFKGNKLYSSLSYEEFMDNGGNNISELLKCVNEKNYPHNIHEYHKSLLKEEWKKQVYDEIINSIETKTFDVFESELRHHVTKKQFKYLERLIFECLDIEILNGRKRNLFAE
jgi:hypothetical protein